MRACWPFSRFFYTFEAKRIALLQARSFPSKVDIYICIYIFVLHVGVVEGGKNVSCFFFVFFFCKLKELEVKFSCIPAEQRKH